MLQPQLLLLVSFEGFGEERHPIVDSRRTAVSPMAPASEMLEIIRPVEQSNLRVKHSRAGFSASLC